MRTCLDSDQTVCFDVNMKQTIRVVASVQAARELVLQLEDLRGTKVIFMSVLVTHN